MLRFIVRRLLLMVPVLFGLIVLLFVWVRALPGDPARALLGERATPRAIARVNELYGFDQPLLAAVPRPTSSALLQGDFGTLDPDRAAGARDASSSASRPRSSWPSRPCSSRSCVGIPLGYFAATRARAAGSTRSSSSGSLLGVVIPVFFLAYLLKLVFAVVAAAGCPTAASAAGSADRRHPHHRTSTCSTGCSPGSGTPSWDAILHLILPAIALGTIPLAIIVRITRASVLEVLNEDYVRTAEAKGLAPRRDHPPARAAQRAAAGRHHDRSADRAAAVRRRAHRDGVRLQRHRVLPVRGDQPARLSRCCRASSCSSRSSTSLVNLLVDVALRRHRSRRVRVVMTQLDATGGPDRRAP